MVDAAAIYAVADSYFTLHLLASGEEDVAPAGDEAGDSAGETAADESMRVLPENLVDDFLDEAVDMFNDIASAHEGREHGLVFGFVDGALAVANDTWSSLEDAYFEDTRRKDASTFDFSKLDAAIDEQAAGFEGERPWDEAAKGYVRSLAARSEDGGASADHELWSACAHAFMYGADAAYDLEWKFVITPAGNVMISDEDSISEAALAQMNAGSGPGKGSLLDRVFDMMGIDLDELADALGAEAEAGEAEEGGQTEAEPIAVDAVKADRK